MLVLLYLLLLSSYYQVVISIKKKIRIRFLLMAAIHVLKPAMTISQYFLKVIYF